MAKDKFEQAKDNIKKQLVMQLILKYEYVTLTSHYNYIYHKKSQSYK
ncbi:hypothetical protein K4Q45_10570 [Staphylococcus epidermidis]|nr:hypothetical protein [Staphylococcus epidermidis]MCG1337818.1 hypothetical protein [Staphylococcus epidermidis]MCG1621420.1 hypothetical protein [Staphylococcus epidermidis]MCG1741634.1 hypothetical protein [Staphylococcus epidermidis]MDH8902344.1 hypothetical protein [Staphylococcus epidermidis]